MPHLKLVRLSVAIPTKRSPPHPFAPNSLGIGSSRVQRSERVANEQAKGDGLGYRLSVHHETVAFIRLPSATSWDKGHHGLIQSPGSGF